MAYRHSDQPDHEMLDLRDRLHGAKSGAGGAPLNTPHRNEYPSHWMPTQVRQQTERQRGQRSGRC